jgi:hypothetical protein
MGRLPYTYPIRSPRPIVSCRLQKSSQVHQVCGAVQHVLDPVRHPRGRGWRRRPRGAPPGCAEGGPLDGSAGSNLPFASREVRRLGCGGCRVCGRAH